jgi:hypothetical protein
MLRTMARKMTTSGKRNEVGSSTFTAFAIGARKMTTSGKRKDCICSSTFTTFAIGFVSGTVGYAVGTTYDKITQKVNRS